MGEWGSHPCSACGRTDHDDDAVYLQFAAAEAERDRMRPVVEAARALRDLQRRDVLDRVATSQDVLERALEWKPIREAFEAAVDTYEKQTGGTE